MSVLRQRSSQSPSAQGGYKSALPVSGSGIDSPARHYGASGYPSPSSDYAAASGFGGSLGGSIPPGSGWYGLGAPLVAARTPLPAGSSYFSMAKRCEYAGELRMAFVLFHEALLAGDRPDSALKDLCNIYVMFGRLEEALAFLQANRHFATHRPSFNKLVERIQAELEHSTANAIADAARAVLVELPADIDGIFTCTPGPYSTHVGTQGDIPAGFEPEDCGAEDFGVENPGAATTSANWMQALAVILPNPCKVRLVLAVNSRCALVLFSTASAARKALNVKRSLEDAQRLVLQQGLNAQDPENALALASVFAETKVSPCETDDQLLARTLEGYALSPGAHDAPLPHPTSGVSQPHTSTTTIDPLLSFALSDDSSLDTSLDSLLAGGMVYESLPTNLAVFDDHRVAFFPVSHPLVVETACCIAQTSGDAAAEILSSSAQ